MASLEMKIKAERRMRDLLEEECIPRPDRVEYGYGCIRLFWQKSKLCVIVDIDDHREIGESVAAYPGRPFDWSSEAEDDPSDPDDPAAPPAPESLN